MKTLKIAEFLGISVKAFVINYLQENLNKVKTLKVGLYTVMRK
jgi:hypothetical protein